jgi:glutamine cyclotransferase
MRSIAVLLASIVLAQVARADALASVPLLAHRVIDKRPHDAMLFTQGMVFHGDHLVESGGGYRESRLLVRTIGERSPAHAIALPRTWFAEGVAVMGERVVMLTWNEGIAQEYTLPTLQPLRQFKYNGEGWGLTSDGTSFIQSNGSATLTWRDARDFRSTRKVLVRAGGTPFARLNELEWVDGWLFANVWTTDTIVLIDPERGEVRARLELAGLLNEKERAAANVLNGIAWHAASRTLWISGKRWPWMFALQVELPPR